MKDSANISHRKAKEVIRVFNTDGTPAAGKKIKVKQTRHSFLFGCGSFDFIPYVMNKDEEHKELVDTWQEIFNYGTLPFYWGQYEPEEGKPNLKCLWQLPNL